MNKKQGLNTRINLVPKQVLIHAKLKIVQKAVITLAVLSVLAMSIFAAVGYIRIGKLNAEIEEDNRIIAEGHLDELNALKEQYDNLILGIDSGNITLIPAIDIKMTELFTIITNHKPEQAVLTGVDGQLKSTGEYTYRMEYSSSDRTVVSVFLEKLQEEKLEYINISTISKSVVDDQTQWTFAITVKIGGIEE